MGSVPEIAHYGLHYIPWTIFTASKGSDFNILSAAILHNVKSNDLRISCPLGIGVRQVFSPTTIFMEVVVPTPRVYTLVLLRYVSVPLLITNFNTVEHCLLECIVRQMCHCMGGNFNIHIWAWSASPSVQVGR